MPCRLLPPIAAAALLACLTTAGCRSTRRMLTRQADRPMAGRQQRVARSERETRGAVEGATGNRDRDRYRPSASRSANGTKGCACNASRTPVMSMSVFLGLCYWGRCRAKPHPRFTERAYAGSASVNLESRLGQEPTRGRLVVTAFGAWW